MKFDFGEVLARAGQLTWKYNGLWLAGVAVSLALHPSFHSLTVPSEVNGPLLSILLANGLAIFLTLLSLPLLAFSPLYAIFQSILLTFRQSVWTLIYLRLMGAPNPLQPLPQEATK